MSKALAYFCAGLMAALAFLPNPLFAQGYENPPTLSAAKVLPPDLLQSPYHKIVGRVNGVTASHEQSLIARFSAIIERSINSTFPLVPCSSRFVGYQSGTNFFSDQEYSAELGRVLINRQPNPHTDAPPNVRHWGITDMTWT